MAYTSPQKEHGPFTKTILTTSPNAEVITKVTDSVFTLRKKLVNNPDENRLIQYLYCSLTDFVENFYESSKITIAIEDQCDPYKRKSGQFYTELVAIGSENNLENHFDCLVNVLSYLTSGTLEEFDFLDHAADKCHFSAEEATFLDNCIGKFTSKYSGTKISKPFECHYGLIGYAKIYFNGRIKRNTLHQVENRHITAVLEIHGFNDINRELYCKICDGESPGKVITLHTTFHEIFIQAAQGYVNGTRFSGTYKEKVNIREGKKINELQAFNPIAS